MSRGRQRALQRQLNGLSTRERERLFQRARQRKRARRDPRPVELLALELLRQERRRSKPEEPAEESAAQSEETGTLVEIKHRNCIVWDGGEEHYCELIPRLARSQKGRVAVGDRVRWTPGDEQQAARVTHVLPRRSALSRVDTARPDRPQTLAANLDQVLVVISVEDLEKALRPLDRILIAIAQGGAEPVLFLNKLDRMEEPELLHEVLSPWSRMGMAIIAGSALTGEGLSELRESLQGRVALVGLSGAGKSTLLNAFLGELRARTGEVRADGKGRHTTTSARLYRLEGSLELVDTPGIRAFALWNIEPVLLQQFFPELFELAGGCRYRDCLHAQEPQEDCSVQQWLEEEAGDDGWARYESYLRILQGLQERAAD